MTNEELQAKLALAPSSARIVVEALLEDGATNFDVKCVAVTTFPSGQQYVTLYDCVPNPTPLYEKEL